MRRKPTIKDVAELAGVGAMTVSRLLNHSAHVSDDAASRIHAAIEKLDYRPNEMARALRAQRSRTLGMIVPYLYDSFFPVCAHAVSTVARENGYSVILTTSNEDTELEYTEAQLMLRRRVDGLVVIPASRGRSRLNQPEFQDIPILAMDRPLPDHHFGSVVVENRSGAARAVDHLITVHGHKRIVVVTLNEQLYTFRTRLEGYRDAMEQAGLKPRPPLNCPTAEAAAALLPAMLRAPHAPTALFFANGLSARYALKALIDSGIRIPQDLAVVGFDDFDMADVLEPRLSVIRQPAGDMGRVAAELLLDQVINGHTLKHGMKVELPVEWIPRRSCGCSAA